MQVSFQIVPEDISRKWYSLSWEDTLGLSEGYLPENQYRRPKELWCVVTNTNQDTLGYYTGLSTAMSFCNFQSDDSLIQLNFSIGWSMFQSKEHYFSEEEIKEILKEYPIEFKPIVLHLDTCIRRDITVILEEK